MQLPAVGKIKSSDQSQRSKWGVAVVIETGRTKKRKRRAAAESTRMLWTNISCTRMPMRHSISVGEFQDLKRDVVSRESELSF